MHSQEHTEQQKAEAYVRSQILELVETVTSYSDERYPEGLEQTVELPIQLQHWLSVLGYVGASSWIEGGILGLVKDGKVVEFLLTTGQPATEADYKAFNDITSV